MAGVTPDASLEILQRHEQYLALHFAELRNQRASLGGDAPVFALEHGLSTDELAELKAAVRLVVAEGFRYRHWRDNWLPFVVYASEVGYSYAGDEFWTTFDLATPGWVYFGDRTRIRIWFQRFALEFGGAIPAGAFAKNFSIIAWPITHAVLPVYLQRNLAHLLYDFRMGLTAELLQNPGELGKQLSARAWDYTERFRIFCSNTSLLGHVAAALLSGEGEESPYLLQSTLFRLVDGLQEERQAKSWLQGARTVANRVRSEGFQPSGTRGSTGGSQTRLPNPTDPRLVLRGSEVGWRAYAQLPDLSSLNRRLPHVFDELRTRRARIEGADDVIVARGRLATPGQEIRLTRWPDPDRAFVELENGTGPVNNLLRDQIEVTRGPVWLFKRRAPGLAVEVKSRMVHPGGTYYIVHDGAWDGSGVPGLTKVTLDVTDASALRLAVPEQLSDADCAALVASGLSVTTDVSIRPVGIAASSWDGEGAVEWIAGEPGLIGIHVEQIPAGGTLVLAGDRHPLIWPAGERELFLSLDNLQVGEHELRVTLTDEAQQTLAEGSLEVTIRDPQARLGSAEPGEGIRLLASPSRPTMSEIWEPGAVTIAGPDGLRVDLAVALRNEAGELLDKVPLHITLPLLDSDWVGVAKKVRGDNRFVSNFDRAESIELTVSRAGVGYASLTADRGFQPLRWQLIRERDKTRAHLIDRTDSGSTRIQLYRVETPLKIEECDASSDVVAPSAGGLLRALGAEGIDASAIILLPTRPNDLLGMRPANPDVQTGPRTSGELLCLAFAHQRWADADLPGDVFAQHQRDIVLEAIARALVSLVCGGRWAGIERSLANVNDPFDLIDEMKAAVGEGDEQKRLAKTIGQNLFAWADPASLLTGFAEAIQGTLRSNGINGHDSAPRFLLTLAGRSGQVAQWPEAERGYLLQQVLKSPVLLRAARFAILGTRLLRDDVEAGKGF